nr:hypothetical protein BaRGS_029662 [Batillaria attramentaria]
MGSITQHLVLLALVAMVTWTSQTAEARPLTGAESRQLDRFVNEVMRCGRIPAMSLALVGDDGVVYQQGYGTANPGSRTKTTEDTVFCLGSSTQAFTSVLLAALLSYKEK